MLQGSLAAPKGSTKTLNESDYYIDVIGLEDKEAANNLITAYKSSFHAAKPWLPFC